MATDPFTSELLKQSVHQVMQNWLKPSLEKMNAQRKLRRNIEDNTFFLKFEEYLVSASNEYKYLNTIVFNNRCKERDSL